MTSAHNASSVYDDGPRPTSFRMPSGNFQYQVYSGTINDALHRVSGIQEDFSTGSSLTVANYAYNGRGRLVEVDYTQPTVKLRRDDDANGSYEALDQFGRIKTQTWKHSGGALMDHVSYQYDYASNRTTRDISSSLYATNNLDQVYGYDSLHRLKNFDEGSMSGSSIASPTKEQDWALDTLGNWNNLTEKTSGSTTLNQNRGHNNANELTTIAGASTYVGHDAAGNMTKVPKPTSWSAAYDLEFDAWNRLVRVKDGGATVASYSYDGLHRRIVKTVGATTEQHYYNEQWQLLEVRVGTEASAARQKYVWHPYYIDALAQRFWDGNSDGDFLDTSENHFVMHDGNFNVTSVMTTGGTVFERYYYSPYGKLTVLDSNFAVDSDGLSDVANPYTYTGRQYDSESGIYQYRYRYYHAQLGRFVGRDPIGYQAGTRNLYQYVKGASVNAVDPSGQADLWFWWYYNKHGEVLNLNDARWAPVLAMLEGREATHVAKNNIVNKAVNSAISHASKAGPGKSGFFVTPVFEEHPAYAGDKLDTIIGGVVEVVAGNATPTAEPDLQLTGLYALGDSDILGQGGFNWTTSERERRFAGRTTRRVGSAVCIYNAYDVGYWVEIEGGVAFTLLDAFVDARDILDTEPGIQEFPMGVGYQIFAQLSDRTVKRRKFVPNTDWMELELLECIDICQ